MSGIVAGNTLLTNRTAPSSHETSGEVATLSPALKVINQGNSPIAESTLQGGSVTPIIHPEISSKTEGVWTCKNRELDATSEGFIYEFRLNDEYDDITPHLDRTARFNAGLKKQQELFPAIQSQGFRLLYLDPKNHELCFDAICRFIMHRDHPNVSEGSQEYQQLMDQVIKNKAPSLIEDFRKHAATFRRLGYGCEYREDGVYLKLPDRTTLLDRWNKLRQERPELPPLDIACLDGDVDAAAFLSTYLAHDVLLSNDKEFLHDHLLHVLATIELMLDSGTFVDRGLQVTYEIQKNTTRAYIGSFYQELMPMKEMLASFKKQIDAAVDVPADALSEMERGYKMMLVQHQIFETLLSIVADSLASQRKYEIISKNIHMSIQAVFLKVLESPQWAAYLNAQFPSEDINRAWGQMRNATLRAPRTS